MLTFASNFNIIMRIVIGCVPGSGSSLLHSLLSKHSLIYGDEESHIYTKPKLITEWNKVKNRPYARHFKSQGWHLFHGFNPKSSLVQNIILLINKKEHPSFESFTKEIELRIAAKNQSLHWVDKTPGNIFGFEALQAHGVQCQKIIIVRNPFDNVASLIARGDSVFNAVAQCVTSLAKVALLRKKEADIHLVHYEDLVKNPAREVGKIWDILNVPSEPVWDRSEKGRVQMSGWQYFEDGKIGTKSIGRFQQLRSHKKIEMANAAHQIYTHPSSHLFENNSWNLFDLAAQFNYDIPILPKVKIRSLRSEILKDKLRRTLRLYPTNIFNYPIKLKL